MKRIRQGILDEVFKPGEHLGELELAERFEVSRSPVREALLALEKEGTVIINSYKGAIVKPLSAAEVLDIAELRLALISLALKPAHRHLCPADFDYAYDLAKRVTRSTNAKDFFEYNCQFWDSIFSKAQRPILHEVFRQLEDRMARYYPLLLKVFPTPETRPRPSEVLMEMYRKGKIAEAFRAFKKIYLEIVGPGKLIPACSLARRPRLALKAAAQPKEGTQSSRNAIPSCCPPTMPKIIARGPLTFNDATRHALDECGPCPADEPGAFHHRTNH